MANPLHVHDVLGSLGRKVTQMEAMATSDERSVLESAFEMEATQLMTYCQDHAPEQAGKVIGLLSQFRERILEIRKADGI